MTDTCSGVFEPKNLEEFERGIDKQRRKREVVRVTDELAGTPRGQWPHHWTRGPGKLIKLDTPKKKRSSDGVAFEITHFYPVTLGMVPTGVDAENVISNLSDTWQHSSGWIRAGIWIYFTSSRLDAKGIVHVRDGTGTTNPGCNNCSNCSCVHDNGPGNLDDMQLLREHLGLLFIKNHEMGHLAFDLRDMYRMTGNQFGAAYRGVMDIGAQSTPWPTDLDIKAVNLYKQGQAKIVS